MRTWLIILAIVSATLAGTTAWLARELSQERARSQESTAQAGAGQDTSQSRPATAAPPARQTATLAPAAATQSNSAAVVMADNFISSPEDMKQMQAEFGHRTLDLLSTADGREDMVAQHRVMFRQMYPRIDKALGLSPEEYSKFLELLAQQQVDAQERQARCMVDPGCDARTVWNTSADPRAKQINDMLGSERSAKFNEYKNTMGERETVSQLATRLPDSQRLSAETAENLISALADERDAISRETLPRTGEMSSFGFGASMIMTSGNTFEERYDSARRNSQRLRDRASQYLNTEQMRTFNEMQDDTLVGMRAMLRNKDGGGAFGAVAVEAAAPPAN